MGSARPIPGGIAASTPCTRSRIAGARVGARPCPPPRRRDRRARGDPGRDRGLCGHLDLRGLGARRAGRNPRACAGLRRPRSGGAGRQPNGQRGAIVHCLRWRRSDGVRKRGRQSDRVRQRRQRPQLRARDLLDERCRRARLHRPGPCHAACRPGGARRHHGALGARQRRPNLRFAYQSGVALSPWQSADLSATPAALGLIWRLPAQRTDPSGDYLLIEPGIPGDGTAVEIQSIRIDLLAREPG